MKKRLLSLVVMLAIMSSVTVNALAVSPLQENNPNMPVTSVRRASAYLDGYTVGIEARGNGTIAVMMNVDGTGVMDKIGVREVEIDYKENGTWKYYDSLYAAEHPEFYDYDSRDFMGTTYFQGTPSVLYRVTLTVYAGNSTGHDTGYITSYAVTCK